MIRNLELFANTPLERLIEEHPGILLRVDEIQISARIQHCLRAQHHLLSDELLYVGDIIQQSELNLLCLPNFGRKSLREIIDVLSLINLSLGIYLPCWPPEDIGFFRKRYSKLLTKQKENLYALTHKVSASCLEDELFNIANIKGERNTHIFVQRMGWDGNGRKTLDAVGQKYGMTRERVRQICEKIEKAIRLTKPPIKFLKQALHHVSLSLPSPANKIENELTASGISHKHFRIEGLITAADFFCLRAKFVVKKVGRKKARFAVSAKYSGTPSTIIQQARKHIEHWGAGTINDLTCTVNEKCNPPISDEFTTMVLESLENFRWLDKDTGWFWLRDNKRNRINNLIRKILSVADKLTIDDLRNGIMRPYRMRGYSPPRRVLKEICKQSGYKVEDGLVIADPPLKWEDVLEGTNAFDLVMALKFFGPVLTRSDFEQLCVNKGMNRTSFYMYLGASPMIQRYSRGIYGLRGANVSAAEIEKLRKRVEEETQIRIKAFAQNKVLLDFGRTSEGNIWIGYKLSDSSVISGIVTIPSSIQKYIVGEFPLFSADEINMGTLKSNNGNTWGLKPFFRRRGAEPGDYMLLMYDLNRKSVSVKLGDEDILESVSSLEKEN